MVKNIKTNKKEEREEALAKKFLDLYSKSEGLNIQYIQMGNPNQKEPDIICSDDYSIEIVSSYDNKSQAKQYWEQMKGIENPYQSHEISLHTVEELQDAIYTKLEKLNNDLYSGVEESKVILLCYCASPLFDQKTAEQIQYQYLPFKPDNHFDKYFSETWIIWWEGGDVYEILKLE